MDLSGGAPLQEELAERVVIVDRCGGGNDARELIDESPSVGGGEKLDPGERVGKRVTESCRAVNGEVSKSPSDGCERVGPLHLAVGPGEA